MPTYERVIYIIRILGQQAHEIVDFYISISSDIDRHGDLRRKFRRQMDKDMSALLIIILKMNMLMKQNDFNHLATLLTANEGAIIKFSEEDIRYLSDETDVLVCQAETDDISTTRLKLIREKLKQQTESVADNFSNCLFMIEMNPEHQLLTNELKELFDDDTKLSWGLRVNPKIASVKVTEVLSGKNIDNLKYL